MILTCPQCSSRYLLSAFALAPEGRRVKCSSCSEVWFQLPDPKELHDQDADIEFQEIPEAVKPIPEGSSVPVIPGRGTKKSRAGAIKGYATAAMIFLAVLGGLVKERQKIVDAWPPAALMYEMAKLPVTVAGEGLMFDAVKASAEDKGDGEKLTVEGRLMNVAPEIRKIPALEAEFRDNDGNILAHMPVPLTETAIDTGQGVDFTISYDAADKKTGDVRLHFLMKKGNSKTGAEAGGNNPVPAPADSSPPTAAAGGA